MYFSIERKASGDEVLLSYVQIFVLYNFSKWRREPSFRTVAFSCPTPPKSTWKGYCPKETDWKLPVQLQVFETPQLGLLPQFLKYITAFT